MMRLSILLVSLWCALTPAAALAQEEALDENFVLRVDGEPKGYATFLGTPITDLDAAPAMDVARRMQEGNPPEAFMRWLANDKAMRLRQAIIDRMKRHYMATNDVEPTERQIQGAIRLIGKSREDTIVRITTRLGELQALREQMFQQGMGFPEHAAAEEQRLKNQKTMLQRALDTSQIREPHTRMAMAQADREQATTIVNAWLLRKTIFEEYGGKVARNNATYEPVEAFGRWTGAYEDAGHLEFADANTREWFYSTMRFNNAPLIDAPDGAFDAPPWNDILPPSEREPVAGQAPADAEAEPDADG